MGSLYNDEIGDCSVADECFGCYDPGQISKDYRRVADPTWANQTDTGGAMDRRTL